MTDPAITPAPVSDQDTTLPPLQQLESPPQPDTHPNPSTNTSAISFSVWPPTQRTRDAVINRLIETLSTPSVLSKRYGTLSSDEASTAAHQIEEESFAVAAASASTDEDGIEILQVYSKEISKRMIDVVKARAPPSSAVNNGAASVLTDEDGNAASVSEA